MKRLSVPDDGPSRPAVYRLLGVPKFANIAVAAWRGPYQKSGDYLNWARGWWDHSKAPVNKLDTNGVVMVTYDNGKTHVYNPVSIAQHCFWLHSEHVGGGKPLSPQFRINADFLMEMQGADGAIRYPFSIPGLPAGRVSGMAQGHAMSVWTRAFKLFGDTKYLDAARKAYEFLILPVEEGGCLNDMSDLHPSLKHYKHVEEFPYKPNTYPINGSIFALLGVYDWSEFDTRPEVMCFFEHCVDGLAKIADYFDVGGYTASSIRHYTTDLPPQMIAVYHMTNLRVVWALDMISPRPELRAAWQKWAKYVDQPLLDQGELIIKPKLAENKMSLIWTLNTTNGTLQGTSSLTSTSKWVTIPWTRWLGTVDVPIGQHQYFRIARPR